MHILSCSKVVNFRGGGSKVLSLLSDIECHISTVNFKPRFKFTVKFKCIFLCTTKTFQPIELVKTQKIAYRKILCCKFSCVGVL